MKAELEKICVDDLVDWKKWIDPLQSFLSSPPVAQLLSSVQAFDSTNTDRKKLAQAFGEERPPTASAVDEAVEQARTQLAVCNVAQKLFAQPGPKQTRTSMVSQAMMALKDKPKAMPDKLEEATRRILNRKT